MAEQARKKIKGARKEKRKYYKNYDLKTVLFLTVVGLIISILLSTKMMYRTPTSNTINNAEKEKIQQLFFIIKGKEQTGGWAGNIARKGAKTYITNNMRNYDESELLELIKSVEKANSNSSKIRGLIKEFAALSGSEQGGFTNKLERFFRER